MKNLSVFLSLFLGSVLFTGCFDLIEEVRYNKDGSGTYSFLMDMGEMKELLAMVMASDSTGAGSLDSLGGFSKEVVKKLEGLPGISDLEVIDDQEAFQFGYRFSFRDLDALNNALKESMEGQMAAGQEPTGEDYFSMKRKEFRRLDPAGFQKIVKESMGSMGDDENSEMAMMFLKDVSYRTIYHFERDVKKVSNPEASISEDQKTVTLTYFLFDEERSKAGTGIENTIKLK